MATTATLKDAIVRCVQLLNEGRPTVAESQAREILAMVPDEVNGLRALAESLRMQGNANEAVKMLTPLVARAADFNLAHQSLGHALFDIGHVDKAVTHLQIATNLDPQLSTAWRLLGECYQQQGEDDRARSAFNHHLATSNADPRIGQVVNHISKRELGKAEALCRQYLKEHPTDVTIIRMLADVAIQLKVYDDAALLLERCLELAPDFHLARFNYAQALSGKQQPLSALEQLDLIEAATEAQPSHQTLKASVLTQIGRYDEALELYEWLVSLPSPPARTSMSFGHALKTAGDQHRAVEQYRNAINAQPSLGEAYWSLANLKTYRLSDDDIAALKTVVHGDAADRDDFIHACFALGKAFDDRKQAKNAFRYYQEGNRVRAKVERYNADTFSDECARIKAVCNANLYAKQTGGCEVPDPIFIVGLPRSGSTLLEQILSSHSQVDGTKELPDIIALARQIAGKPKKGEQSNYPEGIAQLSDDQARELGEEYLRRAAVQRGDSPFFIDKMPNNFVHIGLIQRILPNAKIIDARRDPMDTCFSGFKQLFASGQRFSYSLDHISRYYLDYVNLMAHYDQVLPGKVLRVQYETVVDDLETQVRRILDYCALPFEPQCLEFYNNKRAVRTASSEQVRQPIYQQGKGQWQPYADYLAPVANRFNEALGTSYPVAKQQTADASV